MVCVMGILMALLERARSVSDWQSTVYFTAPFGWFFPPIAYFSHPFFSTHTQDQAQVVESAMVGGVAYLSSFLLGSHKLGIWTGM